MDVENYEIFVNGWPESDPNPITLTVFCDCITLDLDISVEKARGLRAQLKQAIKDTKAYQL